jgi:hypothetical protein
MFYTLESGRTFPVFALLAQQTANSLMHTEKFSIFTNDLKLRQRELSLSFKFLSRNTNRFLLFGDSLSIVKGLAKIGNLLKTLNFLSFA